MAGRRQRITALIAAFVFLVSTVAFSVYVLWEMNNQDNEIASQADTQETENTLKGSPLSNFTPVDEVEELQVTDLQEGDGEVVPEGATVTAHYTGALARTGVVFESSRDFGEPIAFSLNQVIQGWQQGVPGMKVGGIRRILIPADLAYGEQGSPPAIGPNEPLVFDVEIVKIGE